jgi:ornithine decarboxylase
VLAEVAKQFEVEVQPASTTLKDILARKTTELGEEPFYVVDLGTVARKYEQWRRELPRVEPFYAIKCNPDPAVIRTLHELGAGFDCASRAELQQVLAVGAQPRNVIYANPCKIKGQLEFAEANGITMMTFDNTNELHKIHEMCPSAEVVLRILTDDSKSVCRFGSKFGATYIDALKLICLAKQLNMKLIGVSFHVGSGCYSVDSFVNAVDRARKVFDAAEKVGFNMTLLDIGGGWPGDDSLSPSFADITTAIRPRMDKLFPAHVRIIGEPGRYMVSASHNLAVNVLARRDMYRNLSGTSGFEDLSPASDAPAPSPAHALVEEKAHGEGADTDLPNDEFLYYVNDGVYGSFNCLFFDHAHVTPLVLKSANTDPTLYVSNIFGPTCDSLDLINKRVLMPKLEIGDWLYFEQMGAYTRAAGSAFNGFQLPSVHYVWIPQNEQ